MAVTVLPKLIKKTESIDLNVRHGAILAIGETIYALSQTKLPNGKYYYHIQQYALFISQLPPTSNIVPDFLAFTHLLLK